MKVYSCEQMRSIEENAFNKGMSYITMMENAGISCYKKIKKIIGYSKKKIVVLCGNGKNGGDGFVIADFLFKDGYDVEIILSCGLPKASESVEMYSRLDDNIIITDFAESDTVCFDKIKHCDVIIDCIFGIGFKGLLRGNCLSLVEYINNNSDAVKISVDIPSGLEGDSGLVSGECFKADYTLAVTCKKPVHILKPSSDYCGEVFVIDIGFSQECYLLDGEFVLNSADDNYIRSSLPLRKSDSNKGTFGRLFCICGSMRMQGAAVLCGNAAVKSGAGLVTCAFPIKAYSAIASKLTEPLMLPLDDDKDGFLSYTDAVIKELESRLKSSDAVVIGCGLGVTADTKKLVEYVVQNSTCPIVIDADGLNVLSENINILKTAKVPVILTPHPGEMSRLVKADIDYICNNRIEVSKDLSRRTGSVVLLKGSNTVIASGDDVFINPTGNQGMAKGGSGDVLSGIIGSLLAQGAAPFESAISAAYLHGRSGDLVAEKTSLTGMTPTMVTEFLPFLFSNYENKVD